MSYDAEVLSDSPVVFWAMNDSGTSIADSSGNGHTGTLADSIAHTSLQPSILAGDPSAYSIAVVGMHITAAGIPLPGTGDFTFEIWEQTTETAAQMVLIDMAGSNLQVAVGTSTFTDGAVSINGPGGAADGNPHHLVGVRRSGAVYLYKDGASVGTPMTSSFDLGSGTGTVEVGSLGLGSYYFRGGNLQKFAYYTTALSAARITAHYNAGTTAGGPDTTPPTVSAITVPPAGTTLTATSSESGCVPTSGTGGFTVSGTSATVASWAISGTTLTLTLTGLVLPGETVTLSYDRATTTDDIADAAGNFLANFSAASVTNNSTAGTAVNNLVTDGDSLTLGYPGAGQGTVGGATWQATCLSILGSSWQGVNFGESGDTWAGSVGDALVTVDPAYDGTKTHNVLIAQFGTNDLGVRSASAVYDEMVAYLDARRAAGWAGPIVVSTVLPAGSGSTLTAFNAARATYNDLLRDNRGTLNIIVVDLARDARMGYDAAPADTAYYADTVHPTDAGRVIEGQHFADGVLQAIMPAAAGGGTYTAAANVRSGTDRGDGVTGTLVVPPANKVVLGEVFDNGTVGTAGTRVLIVGP